MKILRPEVQACIVETRGIHDLFDNLIKVLFNITDEEYDFIAEHSTDHELDVFVTALGTDMMASTFGERRKAIELRDKMLARLNKEKNS